MKADAAKVGVCALLVIGVSFAAWKRAGGRPNRTGSGALAAVHERTKAPLAPDREAREEPGKLVLSQTPGSHVRDPFERPVARDGAVNVVLVVGCTLRKDQLPPYGGPPDLAPFVSRLASEGAVFEDLVAASSWTKESSAAVLTGFHPTTIGLIEPGPGRNHRVLADRVETFADRFTSAGYYTVGVTGNPNLNVEFGLAQGFDRYLDTKWITEDKRHASKIAADAIAMMDERTEAEKALPLYLQLMVVDGHHPRAASKDEVARFREPGVNEEVARYRVMIERLDAGLTELDASLRERGYTPDNTLFVLTADHGEGLSTPKHHGRGHGGLLMPSVTYVPWILRGPGVAAGHRIAGMASQIDVVPTLMSLAALEPDPSLPGTSWATQVRGERGATDLERAFSDTWYTVSNRAAVWTPTHMCQRDFRRDGVGQCYQRVEDPDLSEPFSYPDLVAELEAWRAARFAEYEAWDEKRDAVVDENTAAQLEALGYLDD